MRILPALAFLFVSTLSIASPKLATLAETSGWKKTGRYEEVIRLCHGFEKAYSGRVRCERFGVTPEGRPMLALISSESGALTPAQAVSKKLPVVLAQGAIHAGECDGKDAGLYLLRELLEHRALPGVLKKVVFVFVPVFNVDGHERFGPHNRPNQRGPEEMGWRVTAQNFNLNRDYVKADAPEMRAMLGLLGAWDPIVYVDLHVTDGADFQHDVAVIIDPTLKGPEALRSGAQALDDGLMAHLKELGHLPLSFYPEFRVDDDPSSGFEAGINPPRFSEAYWGDRNRIGVLVETHSWKNYDRRVHATIDTLSYLLESAARDGERWLHSAHQADREAENVAKHDVVLEYEPTEKSHPIDFLGYEYKRYPSKVSGALMTEYDPSKPKTLRLPFFDELKPKVTAQAPARGYYVSAMYAPEVETRLKLQGIRYQKLTGPQSLGDAQVFRCLQPVFAHESFESRQRLEVKGQWALEPRQLEAGSLFVPIRQPRSYLVMQLLEPEAPDSLLSWGFFNTAFEQKEYMEPYVAEQVARDMLARDPAIKTEFEKRLASDPAFAKDPAKRLDFFYQKHPSWDERFGLYPVYRD